MAKNKPVENENQPQDNENAGSYNPALEHEKNKSEKPERKKRTVISGAEFWKFAPETDGGECDGPVFVGTYVGEQKREKDGKDADKDPSQKAGAVIGYQFVDEDGVMHLISNSHAIQKALEKENFSKTVLWEIEFLGKGQTANNKPYNRFEVSVLE